MNIAVIGASNDWGKYGNKAVRAYKSRGWSVYPVNPREEEIEGLKCYRSILDIAGEIDYVSLYVPPKVGLEVIEEVAKKKPRKGVYFNPGSESRELVEKAHRLGLEPIIACSILDVGADPGRL